MGRYGPIEQERMTAMAERTAMIEQFAERIWLKSLYANEIVKITEEFGFSPPNPFCSNQAPDEVEWGDLPDNVKECIRNLAEREHAIQTTPPTEAAQYLMTLFRELDRLRPADTWSVSSHGIIWDKKLEKLLLFVNRGDSASLHRLRPDELTNDPIATAANIISKAEYDYDDPEADEYVFKG